MRKVYEEAKRWARVSYFGRTYLKNRNGYIEIVPSYPQKVNLRQEGFLAGAEWQRLQEPTEAEIEAAARVFFENLHYPSDSLHWDKATNYVKDNWRLKTRLALAAARKAVESE